MSVQGEFRRILRSSIDVLESCESAEATAAAETLQSFDVGAAAELEHAARGVLAQLESELAGLALPRADQRDDWRDAADHLARLCHAILGTPAGGR